MINDRIKRPSGYAPAHTDAHISLHLHAKGLSPEQIWPYLTNLSDWPRFARAIEEAHFTDMTITNQHLDNNSQFIVNTERFTLVCKMLEIVSPKADRPGYISFEGNATGKQMFEGTKFSFVHICILSPCHNNGLEAASEISLLGDDVKQFMTVNPATIDNFNTEWLHGLIKYVKKHRQYLLPPPQPFYKSHGDLNDPSHNAPST